MKNRKLRHLDYSKIILHPKFKRYNDKNHPMMNATLAQWRDEDKTIHLFLGSFGKCYGIKNSGALQKKIIHTFKHETLHGVIDCILFADRFSGDLTPHYPFLKGLDPDYKRFVTNVDKNEHKEKCHH